MILSLNLNPQDILRLANARGSLVEVLEGAVWVTEAGRGGDACVSRGRRHRIASDGLVLIGADAAAGGTQARVSVHGAAWGRLRERVAGWFRVGLEMLDALQTRRELQSLSDHLLHDIGLRRDQIAGAARNPRWL